MAKRNKRVLRVLEEQLKRYGDERYSEGIARARNARPGPPRRWSVSALANIYLDVEAVKQGGMRPTDAYAAIAAFRRVDASVVKQRYCEASKRFGHPLIRKHLTEQVALHLRDNPDLESALGNPCNLTAIT
jgi:hypothetical protein